MGKLEVGSQKLEIGCKSNLQSLAIASDCRSNLQFLDEVEVPRREASATRWRFLLFAKIESSADASIGEKFFANNLFPPHDARDKTDR